MLRQKKTRDSKVERVYLSPRYLDRIVRSYIFWCAPSWFFESNSILQKDSLVFVPKYAEAHVEAHYGSSWKVPVKDWSFIDDDKSLRPYDEKLWLAMQGKVFSGEESHE